MPIGCLYLFYYSLFMEIQVVRMGRKLLLAGAFLWLFPVVGHGGTLHPPGSTLTLGNVSHNQSLLASVQNPAAGAAALEKKGGQYRFGILSSIGFGYEFGDVDNLLDELDDLSDLLDDASTLQDVEDIKERFDDILVDMGRDGYLKVQGGIHVPLMPIVMTHSLWQGSITFDASYQGQARLGVLDDPIAWDEVRGEAVTNTSLYLKGAVVRQISLGYSRQVWENHFGTLYAGARLKHYEGDFSKNVIALMDADDDVADVFEDEFDANQRTSSALGVDAGVLWVAHLYRLGATVNNLNSPSLSYPSIGTGCDSLSGSAQDNCNTAAYFSNRINLREKYEMEPQLQVEGTLYHPNRQWVVSASLDANPVYDAVGDEVQWFTLSTAYLSESWVIPGYRFGYRKNLTGSELSYVTTGFTLFRTFNLDIAYGLDRIEVDDDEYPRSIMVNLGFDLTF